MITTPSIGSTATVLARRSAALADLRARLDVAQRELATGRRDDVHRALGARGVQAHQLHAEAARVNGRLEGNRILSVRLDVASQALGGAAGTLQSFLEVAVPNRDGPTATVAALRDAARGAYDTLVGQMNASLGGAHLFAGVDTDGPPLVDWDAPAAATGRSPQDVLASILAGGLASGADAAAKAAGVAAAFADADVLSPDRNFERSFYAGTPAEDAAGDPSPRRRAVVGPANELAYGVQANDPAFREALRGLAMIASVDPATLGPDAYGAWVAPAIDAVATGLDGLRDVQARLGGHRARLEDVMDRQQVRSDLFALQIAELEQVDGYEAATRVSFLSAQLEASYAATARLMRLSFLDYM